jgi:hypothetical protein
MSCTRVDTIWSIVRVGRSGSPAQAAAAVARIEAAVAQRYQLQSCSVAASVLSSVQMATMRGVAAAITAGGDHLVSCVVRVEVLPRHRSQAQCHMAERHHIGIQTVMSTSSICAVSASMSGNSSGGG